MAAAAVGPFSLVQIAQILGAISLLYFWIRSRQNKASGGHKLPPGPKGWPIIGNALDIPMTDSWLTFTKWGDLYGDIMSFDLLGQRLIILNAHADAINMLDKRSTLYSDRPTLWMCGVLAGWDRTLVLQQYGPTLREIRRYIHQIIGSRNHVQRFVPATESAAIKLLQNLFQQPAKFMDHIRWSVGATVLMMCYGYKCQEGDDPLIKIADIAVDGFSRSSAAGAWLVDIFPILRFIPSWMPGARFKKLAAGWKRDFEELCDVPFNFTKQQMAAGTDVDNFTSALLEGGASDDKEGLVKMAATSLYSGGADTTVSAVASFFLAMTLHPDAQRKAQKEIDSVVGSDRLPTAADREHLPYINALCLEVLRWNPVGPLGIPHRVSQDDVYANYFIPKNAIVIPNLWAMLHNPQIYTNHTEFLPERFIPSQGKPAENDPRDVCFGFGRRICPGMHLADATLFATVAMTLAAYNITKSVDEHGKTVEPVVHYSSGTISHPDPFECTIKPRSAKAEALVRAAAAHESR